jgi:hypothetical protein
MMPERLPYWCIGKCEIRWDHASPRKTDLVCLSCTMRTLVRPEWRAEIGDDWAVWLPKIQEAFQRSAADHQAADRPQTAD